MEGQFAQEVKKISFGECLLMLCRLGKSLRLGSCEDVSLVCGASSETSFDLFKDALPFVPMLLQVTGGSNIKDFIAVCLSSVWDPLRSLLLLSLKLSCLQFLETS